MLWIRSIAVAFRLAWPAPFAPWRSALLRWRIETYGIRGEDGRLLHADEITPARFFRFAVTHRVALARFLRWAALL